MAKPVRAVERAFEVLAYLNAHSGVNANQVAIGTNLSRGTAARMLETLERAGYVQRYGNVSGYRLTEKVMSLASGFDTEAWILGIAWPEVRTFGAAIVWPAMVAVPRGLNMEVPFTTDSSTPLVFHRRAGGHALPMLASAAGRCYLAFSSTAQREVTLDLLESDAPDPWKALAANRADIKRILRQVRVHGFASSDSTEADTISIAAPIMYNGEPRITIGARYFKRSLSAAEVEIKLVRPLLQTAAAISARLQGIHPPEDTKIDNRLKAPA
jgi:DNA-binding IclR family transcriptional regulator